jgi:hypothetical protein
MFAAPVATPRTPSPHGTASSVAGRVPSQAGQERSFRAPELAIGRPERKSMDTASVDSAGGRFSLSSWMRSSNPVLLQGESVYRLGASAGAAMGAWTAAARPISRARLQAKLEIGTVDDPLESEADQIADQVMGAPGPLVGEGGARPGAAHQIQRKCSACAHEEEHGKVHHKCTTCEQQAKETKLARKAISRAGSTGGMEAPSTVSQVLRSPGQPLDRSSRSLFEPRFGYNFGRVRVHTDEQAAASARSVGALAYTVGPHIVFGSNQYAAGTATGQRLLVHELAHTVQQGAVDDLGTKRAEVGSGSEGMLLQRQEAPGVHASAAPAVPYEKASPDVESRYRRSGLIAAANAVKRCREGDCSKVLTEAEAYAAYRSGRVSAGMGDPPAKEDRGGKETVAAAGGAPLLAGALAQSGAPATAGGGAVLESAAVRAAARWGLRSAADVLVKEAAVPAATPAAAGGAAVAVPVALGVYLIVAVVDLVGYTQFQVALERQGYVILPNILQVCISGCHHADAPTDSFGPQTKDFPKFPFDNAGDKAIRDWIKQDAPVQTPAPMFPPVAGKPVLPAAPATDKPVMPEGLSREKKEKWRRCEELYKNYKQETGAEVGSLAGEIKATKIRVDSLSPKERLDLCSKIHQLIELIEQLIRERREYIDNGCDEFDWFKKGTTEAQRKGKHEGEVDNVKAQEGNMRGVLKELQEKGVC